MQENWLTTRELAVMAGTSDARIRQVILEGKLEAEKRERDWFIPQDEAQRWLDSRKPHRKTE